MLKIPLNIVLSLTVFLVVAGTMLLIFGSPKCDAMANSTAFYLKNSIDEVSKESFYLWDDGGVPPDDQTSYYKTAPIMLCQDKGIGYLDTILGTTLIPQYQIYFERFPEGGGGMWTEAYPWSGGAASELRMWAAFRIGSGVFKLASKYLTKAGQVSMFVKGLKGIAAKIKGTVSETEIEKITQAAADSGEIGLKPLSNPASWYLEGVKVGEAATNIEEGVKEGIFVEFSKGKAAVSNGRLILSEAVKPVSIPVVENGVENMYPVFVKMEGNEIVDMTLKQVEGFEPLQVSPAEMYRDWLGDLPKSVQSQYKGIYVTESDVASQRLSWTSIKSNVKDSGFYQSFFQPSKDRLDSFLTKIETAGYRVDYTEMTAEEINGLKLGTIRALEDNDVSQVILDQPDIKDRIATFLGKSPESIKAKDIKDFLNSFDMNGILFQVKGQDMEILPMSVDKIMKASSDGKVLTNAGLKQAIFDDPEGAQIISDMSKLLGISNEQATTRVGKIVDSIYDSYSPAGTSMGEAIARGGNKVGLYSGFTDVYLKNMVKDYASNDPVVAKQAQVQLASFLGFVEQNKDELPASVVTKTAQGLNVAKAVGRKMIYLDGPQNVLNPDSFYERAFFAPLNNNGCEGNSICVYSYAAMSENPIYLSNDSLNYSVKVWRPVSPVVQWFGIQAALQHVPENPRFYVVSPCMAVAKIWKTGNTIFVYPQKIDISDASNYCYADSNLINEYYAIWTGSDIATIVTTITGLGAAKGAMEIFNKVVGTADPATLVQGMLEGAISWPGWPFEALTWDKMVANENKVGIAEIKSGSDTK